MGRMDVGCAGRADFGIGCGERTEIIVSAGAVG